MLLTLTCLWVTLPNFSLAAQQKGAITINQLTLPSTTLSKGDSFNLSFTFYASVDFTTPKNITISGEAIDSSQATYGLLPADDTWEEGQNIAAGCIVTVNYSNLLYTGTGTDGKISIELDGANASKSFTLTTVSTSNIEGALLLDSSATSNLSGSMEAGESKNFSLQIKNVTSETIKNGVAKAYFNETTTGLSVTAGQYTNLPSINSGRTTTLSFTISASATVKSGTYPLTIELNNMKQTFNLSISSSVTPPTIEISTNANQTFTAGEINNLTLYVKNSGGKAAKNLKIEVTNEADLAVVGSSNVKYIEALEKGATTSYTTKLQLDSNLSSNLTLLKLKLSYTDPSGESYTDTQSIYLNTNGTANTNNLQIINVTGPSGTYRPNQNFTVRFGVTSTNGAEDVKITVKGDDNIVPTSQSVFVLSTLDAKATKNYSITLAGTDKVTTSTHPIEILLEYEYGGKAFTMSQYTSVNIVNPDDDSSEDDLTNPKVILSGCTVSPQIVAAGDAVVLDLNFLNTHASKPIYNLTASLNLNGSSNSTTSSSSNNASNATGTSSSNSSSNSNLSDTFSIQQGNNSIFAAQLASGASHQGTLTLLTSPSASPQTYNIELTLNYEDEDGKDLTSTATIPITISQDVTLDVAQIDLTTLSIGRATALTATIYNVSKADISQVMMYLESDSLDSGFTITDNKSYLATFSMGATEYYAPTLTGVAAGTYPVNLVIEYEDSLGQAQIMRYPFEITVADNNSGHGGQMQNGNTGTKSLKQGMPGDTMNAASTNKTSVKMIVGIIVGLAAVAFILIRCLKKRKQKKEDAVYND